MKKMIMLLFTLVLFYFCIQLLFNFLGKGYEIDYKINSDNNEFDIHEKYIKNEKHEKNSYLLTINTGDNLYSYQIFNKLNDKEVIKEVKYFKKNNIECILPIFNKNKILFDVTCKIDDDYIYYHNMKEKNEDIDKFLETLKNIYDKDMFADNSSETIESELFTIHKDNIVTNHYLSFTNYKGISTINHQNSQTISNIDIFNNDKYSREISGFTEKYYITADYNQNYEFNNFYIVNQKNNSSKNLKDNYKISFDSYVQGIIDDEVYIFDVDNKIQYEIDIKKMNITETGNMDRGIKYYENGKWSKVEANKAIENQLLFKTTDYRKELSDGTIMDTIGGEKTGYIYTYVKKDNNYSLYLSNINTPQIKNYLFEIDNIDEIIYIDDYIYFKNGNNISYYNEKAGLRNVITSEELLFNKNLLYNVTK